MLTTASDVYTQVRERIGVLARRFEDPLATPSDSDETELEIYLEDAISELTKVSNRYTQSLTLTTTPSQEWVQRPPHVDVIEEASVWDGGSAYVLDIEDGQEVARSGRAPDADSDRPECMGAYEGRLYLYPIPDAEYDLDLQVQLNGAAGSGAPAGPQDPPQLDTYVDRTPTELERALVAYVTAEWLRDTGMPEASQIPARRFERDKRRYQDEPVRKSATERPYKPLGF